jgi:hypothetical protein
MAWQLVDGCALRNVQVVTKLWGGDPAAYKDLCYAERKKEHDKFLYDGKKRMPHAAMHEHFEDRVWATHWGWGKGLSWCGSTPGSAHGVHGELR